MLSFCLLVYFLLVLLFLSASLAKQQAHSPSPVVLLLGFSLPSQAAGSLTHPSLWCSCLCSASLAKRQAHSASPVVLLLVFSLTSQAAGSLFLPCGALACCCVFLYSLPTEFLSLCWRSRCNIYGALAAIFMALSLQYLWRVAKPMG